MVLDTYNSWPSHIWCKDCIHTMGNTQFTHLDFNYENFSPCLLWKATYSKHYFLPVFVKTISGTLYTSSVQNRSQFSLLNNFCMPNGKDLFKTQIRDGELTTQQFTWQARISKIMRSYAPHQEPRRLKYTNYITWLIDQVTNSLHLGMTIDVYIITNFILYF